MTTRKDLTQLARIFTVACGVGGYSTSPAESKDTMTMPTNCHLVQKGEASWYGEELRGSPMANRKKFNPDNNTVAHLTLPLGTDIKVVTETKGKTRTADAEVTDRGPYTGGRVLDVSESIAAQLNFKERGTARVSIYVCN